MNLVKFFGLQCLLFGIVLLTNFYLDSYISKPFTYTDFIAIIIGLLIAIPVFILYGKLEKRLNVDVKPNFTLFARFFFTLLLKKCFSGVSYDDFLHFLSHG